MAASMAVIDPQAAHRRIMRVIAGIVLCVFLAAIDQTVVIPAVPAISRELQSSAHLSWLLTAYLLTSTVTSPIYGTLSDLHGRRRLLAVSISLFILASLACGFAASLDQLILFRGLQGIGGGGLMSLAQAALADAVTPRERGRYQAYLAAVWAVASIGGPLVGGIVAQSFSWRWLFWINLPIGLLALWLSHRGLPAGSGRRREGKIRFDVIGSVLMTAAVTLLLLVLTLGGSAMPWLSLPILTMLVVALGLSAVFVVHERMTRDALLPPRLFADPALVCGMLASVFIAATVFASLFTLPVFFQLAAGLDAAQSGLTVMPFLLGTVCGNFATGQLAFRLGRIKPIVVVTSAIAALGFLAIAFAAGELPVLVIVALTTGAGIGLGSSMFSTMMVVQNAAPPRDVGAATGTLLLLRAIGSMFGSAIAGAILSFQLRSATGSSGAGIGGEGGGMPDLLHVGFPATGFMPVFLACSLLAAGGFLFFALMPNVPLRTGPPDRGTHLD